MLMVISLMGLGWLAGKKYPLIGGALFAVAVIALLWGPGGLIVG